MNNEAVLNMIQEICKDKGWSTYRLSEESGISKSTLSTMFGHKGNISLTNLDKICGALGLKMSDFFALLEENEKAEEDREWKDRKTAVMMLEAKNLTPYNKRVVRSLITVLEELEREIEPEVRENGENS